MNKRILTAFITVFIFLSANGQTTVSDNSTIIGTWTTADSPYIIEGRAIVPNGQSLTIEPGVEIRLSSSTSSTTSWFDYSAGNVGVIRVEGTLIADGTSADPILFTRDNTGYWGTILIDDNASTNTSFTNCIIEYAKESRNVTGITSVVTFNGGLSIYNNAINFTNNEIRNNDIDGACIIGADNTLVFTDNDIHDNERNGLNIRDSDAVIVNNSIYNNSFGASGSVTGVKLSNCTVSFVGNLVYNNDDFGIHSTSGGNNSIANNTIVGNDQGIRVEGGANTSIVNTIIQNNDLNFAVSSPGGATIEMEYSLTDETSLPSNITDLGNNILSGDAFFTNSGGNDYTLLNNSPCIDAGTPNTSGLNLPGVDVLGNNRIDNGTVDIGAVEYQQPIVEFDVVTSSSPSSGGTSAGDGTYADGSSVTVTATASTGYNFVNWTEGGAEVSTNSSYTFNISSDRNLVANFESTASLDDPNSTMDQMSCYPNPTRGKITIVWNKKTKGKAVLTDSKGQVLCAYDFDQDTTQLDLTHHSAGVYFLHVKSDEEKIVKRIIKK